MSKVALCEVAEVIRGVTFSSEESSGISEKGMLPVIRAGSIQKTLLLNEGLLWIPEQKIKPSQKIRKDDIIICTSSGSADLVGKCAKSDVDFDGSFGAFCAGIRPKQGKVSASYLYHFLCSPNFRNWTCGSSGANIKNIRISELAQFEISLPPLAEQKRIAAILDKADAVRRKRQQAIQLADDFLRAVFLEMFGDPVTNPKGWEVKPFSYIGNWSSGGTPSRSSPQFFNGDINWYSAGELNFRYLSGSVEKITKDAVAKSAAKLFPAGSMLLGMYDTAAFKLSILLEESACNQACANVIPNDTVDIEWLYSYLSYTKEHYLKARRGVRQKNLNLGMIKEFELPLPPKKEQERFTALVYAINKKLESASISSEACSSLFHSLSVKAFSGQL